MQIRSLIPMALGAGLVFAAAALLSMAQETPTSPQPGSAERKAILDAMRGLGNWHYPPVFVVRYLKVQGGWAWVTGDPQSADGKSHYETESALLHKESAGWKVEDTPCATEDCDYRTEMTRIRAAYPNAPEGIFPH